MKKLIILLTLAFIPWLAVPGDCFIDYLFGGSATSDAIGNNVVGDQRPSVWTDTGCLLDPVTRSVSHDNPAER